MKKSIVLDIDGVIIGSRNGINRPHPHPDVMAKLKNVRNRGIPIILCTAKPAFAIEYEIKEADLNNPHIADSGALLVDNKGKVYEQFLLEPELAHDIVKAFLNKNVYVEVYTKDDYYIQSDQKGEWADQHASIMQREPKVVDDLADFCMSHEITKIIQVVATEAQKPEGDKNFAPFANRANQVWAIHPAILPLQFAIITAPNVTKVQGLIDIAKIIDVNLCDMLAVGDSTSDWNFMSECGYVGAMGNASDELKDLVTMRGGEIGPSVDENGVIDIIDWYLKI